jgi:hypothetical protein
MDADFGAFDGVGHPVPEEHLPIVQTFGLPFCFMTIMCDGSYKPPLGAQTIADSKWGSGVLMTRDNSSTAFFGGGHLPEPKESVDCSVVEAMSMLFACRVAARELLTHRASPANGRIMIISDRTSILGTLKQKTDHPREALATVLHMLRAAMAQLIGLTNGGELYVVHADTFHYSHLWPPHHLADRGTLESKDRFMLLAPALEQELVYDMSVTATPPQNYEQSLRITLQAPRRLGGAMQPPPAARRLGGAMPPPPRPTTHERPPSCYFCDKHDVQLSALCPFCNDRTCMECGSFAWCCASASRAT